MARNKRKQYSMGSDETSEGIPCSQCGCRHSYVIRTERMGGVVRRTRQCRYCGHRYYTTESE